MVMPPAAERVFGKIRTRAESRFDNELCLASRSRAFASNLQCPEQEDGHQDCPLDQDEHRDRDPEDGPEETVDPLGEGTGGLECGERLVLTPKQGARPQEEGCGDECAEADQA